MAERFEIVQRAILAMLEDKKYATLRDILSTMNPSDVAGLFQDLEDKQIPVMFRLLPKELAAETFVEMEPDDQELLIRRLNIVAGRVVSEDAVPRQDAMEQLDLFTDYVAKARQQEADAAALKKEKQIQRTMLDLKKKYGKNAILKGMNLQDGATSRERNRTIGGHQE